MPINRVKKMPLSSFLALQMLTKVCQKPHIFTGILQTLSLIAQFALHLAITTIMPSAQKSKSPPSKRRSSRCAWMPTIKLVSFVISLTSWVISAVKVSIQSMKMKVQKNSSSSGLRRLMAKRDLKDFLTTSIELVKLQFIRVMPI